jgi:hypothetical protein
MNLREPEFTSLFNIPVAFNIRGILFTIHSILFTIRVPPFTHHEHISNKRTPAPPARSSPGR